MTTEISNKISRNISEKKHEFADWKQKIKTRARSLSKTLGLGDHNWINNPQKLQKAEFKQLHKETFEEQVVREKKTIGAQLLRTAADVLDSGDKTEAKIMSVSTSSVSGAVAVAVDVDKADKWTKHSRVSRDLYVQKIRNHVAKKIVEWQKLTSSQQKKSLFIRDGKPIHLFTMPFFNDTIHNDDETISWEEFKKNVFYDYLNNMSANVRKINAEIYALEQIQRAFNELISEKKSKSRKRSGSTTAEVKSEDSKVPTEENDSQKISFGELKKRLALFKTFAVNDEFWKLPCWDSEHLDLLTDYDDFVARWLQDKKIDDLKGILAELQSQQRISVGDGSLVITSGLVDKNAPASNAEINGDNHNKQDYDDESSDEEDNSRESYGSHSRRPSVSENEVSTINAPSTTKSLDNERKYGKQLSEKSGKSISEHRKQLSLDIQAITIPGIPHRLVNLYGKSLSRECRTIIRKLVKLIEMKLHDNTIGNSIDIANNLYTNSILLLSHDKNKQRLEIEQESIKYNELIKKYKKAERLEVIKKEHEIEEKNLLSKYFQLIEEGAEITSLLYKNYRNYLAKAKSSKNKSEQKVENVPVPIVFQDKQNFVAQQSLKEFFIGTEKFVEGATGDAQKLNEFDSIDKIVDYSNEMHEVANQPDDYGFIQAIKSVKEWQEYKSNHSLKRISAKFLNQLLKDYIEDPIERGILDALEIVKNNGLVCEETWNEFVQKESQGRNTEKSRANLLSEAAQTSIDSYLRIKTAEDLCIFLYKYGPALLTLPFNNSNSDQFWVSSRDEKTGENTLPEKWHTVTVVGYNKDAKKFIIRNSIGKSFGTFGYSKISFSNAFTKNSQSIGLVDGKSYRNQK